ncbi:MAG TPA: PAS domain S-box protein [Candidatus Limnocylindrales bacterium]|nr:PAS domain S-box protein [Candidatus Limnocylindrales bacterium]
MTNKSPVKSTGTLKRSPKNQSSSGKDIRDNIFSTSERFYEQVLESMKEGVSLSDESGVIIYTNPAEDEIFGYSRGELIGQHVTVQNTYNPAQNKKIVSEVIRQLKKKGVWQGEFSNRKKDGSPFITWAKITALALNNKNYWLCVQEDITDKKKAADRLRQNEERYQTLIEKSSDIIALSDSEGNYTYVSPGIRKVLGYTPEEFVKINGFKLMHPDELSYIGQKFQKLLDNPGTSETIEMRGRHKNGSWRWIEATATNLLSDPKIGAIVSNFRDINERKQSHDSVTQLAHRNQLILESAGEGIYGLDIQGKITFINPAAAKMLGYKDKELLGKPAHFVIHSKKPDGSAYAKKDCPIYKALRDGTVHMIDNEVFWKKNGASFPVEYTSTPIAEKDKLVGAVVTFQDITERKKTEERQIFLDKVGDALFASYEDDLTLKRVAQLIVANIADYCRIVTVDEENNISDITVNHTDPSQVQLVTELYDQYKSDADTTHGVHKILKTGKAELMAVIDEKVYRTIKNNPKLLKIVKSIGLKSYMGIPLVVHGKVIGAITFSSVAPGRIYDKDDLGFVQELGRRIALALDNARMYRETERSRQEAVGERQRLHELFMQAPAAIGVTRGKDHVFEFTNPLYMKLVGRKESLIGKSVRMAFPELKGQGFFELLDQVYTTGEPFIGTEMPLKLERQDTGKVTEGYVNFVYQPFKNSKGKVQGIMAHAVDVTEQVQAKQKLLDSEERFTLAQQAANIGTFDWNIKSGEFLCTRQLEIIYGLKADGFAHKYTNWLKRIHEDDRARVKHELHDATNGKDLDSEFRIVQPDGSVKWIAIRASVFHDDKGRPERLLGINRNVTKRKLAEEALRDSEERFRSLADSMPQIVWTARPDGYVDYYNKQWYEYTGFKTGKDDQSWTTVLHPDDEHLCMDAWYESVRTGKLYQIEYRFKDRQKPGKYRWFLGRALPVRDKTGKIVKWFGTCTDIDDLHRTIARKNELEKITTALTAQRAQLVLLNKAKDEFISVASHQLRTPATGVKQYLGMTLEGYAGELTPQQATFLRQAYESNERQINIINDLLRVAKVDAGKVILVKQKTDLVAMAENIIHEQNSKFTDRQQTVLFAHDQPLLKAQIDADKIRMVIENIIDNASKYTPHGCTIKVKVFKLQDNICVSVKDEGVGVRQKDIEKMFHKFSRLDNPLSIKVGGTGLGLYWAKKIIDLHGGTIEVDSELKKGTLFTIKIPIS